MAVKPIPDGYHSVTPYLTVEGAAELIEFIKAAFGATERFRMERPDGKLGHSEVQIGDSVVMLADPRGECTANSAVLHLYVPDIDAVYKKALEAGATSMSEPTDQFYGDRSAGVKDPVGNTWWISTHVEDVPPEELQRRAETAHCAAV